MNPYGWNLNPMASCLSEQPNSVRPGTSAVTMTGLAIRMFQSCIQSLKRAT